MPKKIVNKPVEVARAAAEQLVGPPDALEIPPVTNSLLADLQTGMAAGLIGKAGSEQDLNNPQWAAGFRVGSDLRGIAERNGKADAALWRDMARHGEVSGRFGSAEECRPTLIGQDEEAQSWLVALWEAAFAIGAQARAEVAQELES